MCYFLVEGARHTRSHCGYVIRLLAMGLISQLPYQWALGLNHLNMMFTLSLCFFLVVVVDSDWPQWAKVISGLSIAGLSIMCDWSVLAVFFTALFACLKGPQGTKIAYAGSWLLFFGFELATYGLSPIGVLQGFAATLGVAASGFVIIYLYNGKQRKGNPGRWFYYWFYPLHLIVLALLRWHFFYR